MKKYLLALFALSFFCALAQAQRVVVDDISKLESIDEKFMPEADELIVYKKLEDKPFELKMQAFYPNSKKPEKATPAIIFFAGGGWNNITTTQFALTSRILADMGIIAYFAEYRVKKLTGVDDPRKCVEDAKSVVRYVREHAKELGVNPDMIAVAGASAGGHIAAATACLDDFDSPLDNLEISARANLLVLFNPVIDNSEDGYGYNRVKKYFPQISPFQNLKDDMPPSIVFVGDQDEICKYTMCEKYKEFLNAKNIDCQVHIYKGQGHSFFNYYKGRTNYIDTLKKTIEFLQKHNYII